MSTFGFERLNFSYGYNNGLVLSSKSQQLVPRLERFGRKHPERRENEAQKFRADLQHVQRKVVGEELAQNTNDPGQTNAQADYAQPQNESLEFIRGPSSANERFSDTSQTDRRSYGQKQPESYYEHFHQQKGMAGELAEACEVVHFDLVREQRANYRDERRGPDGEVHS